jgi:anti-anti-sigma factor
LVQVLPDAEVGGHRLSGHICWLLADPAAYVDAALELIAEGASLGEKVVVFAPGDSPALAELAAVAAVAADPATRFPAGEPLEPLLVLAVIRDAAVQAQADGYRGLRIIADMDWLRPLNPTTAQIISLEMQIDRLIAELGATVICAYRRSSFDTSSIAAALTTHPSQHGEPSEPDFRFVARGGSSWRLSGEVDFETQATFEAALSTAASLETCVIDVTELRFADVAAMRAIATRAQTVPGGIHLHGASALLQRIWNACGFHDYASAVQFS